VLGHKSEAMNPKPAVGYVWLDTPGKVLHTPEHLLEFRTSDRRTRGSLAVGTTFPR
jgi:hypothetical protein